MNAIAALDLVAAAGFAVAMAFPLLARRSAGVTPWAALLVAGSMGLMVFIGLTNFLEHAGVTQAFDVAEDYAQVLFFPLVGYAVFIIWSTQRMEALRSAQAVAAAEHAMLDGILDASPVAVCVVDDRGCVTYANRYAWEVLGLAPCEGPT